MSQQQPRTRSRGQTGWWVAFAVATVLVAVYSVVSGGYVVAREGRRDLGHSHVGEWADMTEHGLRFRLDSLDYVDAVPVGLGGTITSPPPGTAYLLAQFSIEAVMAPADGLGCVIQLFNADGEALAWTESDAQGPTDHGCYGQTTEVGEVERGDVFQTQTVYIVEPAPLASFTLTVWPTATDERVSWSFSL